MHRSRSRRSYLPPQVIVRSSSTVDGVRPSLTFVRVGVARVAACHFRSRTTRHRVSVCDNSRFSLSYFSRARPSDQTRPTEVHRWVNVKQYRWYTLAEKFIYTANGATSLVGGAAAYTRTKSTVSTPQSSKFVVPVLHALLVTGVYMCSF